MQDILSARDKLRADIEQLDGGYATVGRILNRSQVFVLKALGINNTPRLRTLESIKEAVKTAQKLQKQRIDAINA